VPTKRSPTATAANKRNTGGRPSSAGPCAAAAHGWISDEETSEELAAHADHSKHATVMIVLGAQQQIFLCFLQASTPDVHQQLLSMLDGVDADAAVIAYGHVRCVAETIACECWRHSLFQLRVHV
jgi:hypothetical protein